jgi:hypothetical protein
MGSGRRLILLLRMYPALRVTRYMQRRNPAGFPLSAIDTGKLVRRDWLIAVRFKGSNWRGHAASYLALMRPRERARLTASARL